MKLIFVVFYVVHYLCSSTSFALDCSTNPCQLAGYFNPSKGYSCFQGGSQALCTCPNGGFEIDRPCYVCNRSNPLNNPCRPSPNLLACLESDSYGGTFACLCSTPSGPVPTQSTSCDPFLITTTTTTTTVQSSLICENGGVFIDSICHCPSGYGGVSCQTKYDENLCERIVCQNGGVCAIRNPNGPYISVCFCRYGTFGEYCELNGTLGFCNPNLCVNGLCEENIVASTRHAYCRCSPGYSGIRCDQQYFRCSSPGNFLDLLFFSQGRYFNCRIVNGVFVLEQRFCPKGLRFNMNKNACSY